MVLLKIAIKEREKDLTKYKNKFKVSSPILLDERAQVANTFGVWSHPETFFINREGRIVGRAFGGKDWTSTNIRNFIQYLLSSSTPAKGE